MRDSIQFRSVASNSEARHDDEKANEVTLLHAIITLLNDAIAMNTLIVDLNDSYVNAHVPSHTSDIFEVLLKINEAIDVCDKNAQLVTTTIAQRAFYHNRPYLLDVQYWTGKKDILLRIKRHLTDEWMERQNEIDDVNYDDLVMLP